MIPQETVNKILDTAEIVEVISDFVTLKRRGSNYIACCPFHNEKTPSFYVSPSKGIYKCFGCGKAGSAVRFVMEYEHLSYVEALKYLANKYHIEIQEKEETAEDIAKRQRNESLLLVSEFAQKFFVESLSTQEGHSVGYAYFKQRGLEDETILKYGLGWSPSSRHDFSDVARKAGYKPEYLIDTGLCVQHDDGTLYDRFFERVMFPIHSVSGRVIAFGGRTLKSDHTIAKYVNSKESEIYVKSRSLYGIYFAKNEISRQDKCYLVEGYLDVLSMHQLGIMNVVASSGTSLTVEQIRLIKKFTSNVTIMYDGDAAGIHAALRGIGMVLKEGMNVKVVLIPDNDDPDSYSRKHNLEEVQEFLKNNEQDFIEYKTDLLLGEAGDDPLKKAELINDIADTIAQIPDAIKRSVYMSACASKFNIDSSILQDRINNTHVHILQEEKLEEQRARDRAEMERQRPVESQDGGQAGAVHAVPEQASTQISDTSDLENNKFLAPSEKELLGFILTEGRTPLEFESDSEFYSEDGTSTVADFIFDAIEADETPFYNLAYRAVYNEYFKLYSQNLPQDQIIRTLLNGPDTVIADVTAQLCEKKYMLSVKNLAASLTATSSWLVNYVPRSIRAYQIKKLDFAIQSLTAQMRNPDLSPEDQKKLFKKIENYYTYRRRLNILLGRDRETGKK